MYRMFLQKNKMKIKLTLKSLPPLVNATYKSGGGRFYKSNASKIAQETMRWEIKGKYRGRPLTGLLGANLGFWWGDKRRRDIDSGIKATLDACTGFLWRDDSQLVELFVTKGIDKKKPHTEIEVYPLT